MANRFQLLTAIMLPAVILLTVPSVQANPDPTLKQRSSSATTSVDQKTEQTTETVKDKTKHATETVKDKTGRAVETIKDKTESTVETIKEKTGPTVETVKDKTKHAAETVKDKTENTVDTVKEKTGPTVNNVKEKTGDAVETVKDKAVTAGKTVKKKAVNAQRRVKRAVSDVKQNLTDKKAPATQEAQPLKAMALDTDMQQVIDTLHQLNPKPIETLTPAQARVQPSIVDAVKKIKQEKGLPLKADTDIQTKNIEIAGPIGPIPTRLYSPAGKGPLPVIVYFHGGGWVLADVDAYDASARALAKQANAIVISANYHQAPEHPYPAAHQDAFAVYQWAVKNAENLGGNPQKIAVAGESAGANLAANVSIMARDQHMPMPIHQLLIYPVASTTMNTPSYQTYAEAKPLNKGMMQWFFKQTLKDESAKESPAINLLKADLRQLPSTTLITAEIDPLQSEGKKLGDEMKKAGVTVHSQTYEGVTHEFFGMAPIVQKATQAQKYAAEQLKQAFATESPKVNVTPAEEKPAKTAQ